MRSSHSCRRLSSSSPGSSSGRLGMAQTKDVDFNKRAAEFDEGIEGRASQRFYNLLLREVELRPQATVLDVGCGTGALLNRFAATCDIEGFGIDIAEEMLKVAREKCPQMVFHVARCDDMPFGDQGIDVINACMAIPPFRQQGRLRLGGSACAKTWRNAIYSRSALPLVYPQDHERSLKADAHRR